jgi:hypothetical protein
MLHEQRPEDNLWKDPSHGKRRRQNDLMDDAIGGDQLPGREKGAEKKDGKIPVQFVAQMQAQGATATWLRAGAQRFQLV